MKYLCLLVPQTGMGHLRSDFFSMNKDKRYMPTETFYSYSFLKKPLKRLSLLFTIGNSGQKKLHPWKLRKVVLQPLEIPHFFLITPGYSTLTNYFFNTPRNSMPFKPLYIFYGITHCTCLNCYFSRVSKKFYKVFFRIISSNILCTI